MINKFKFTHITIFILLKIIYFIVYQNILIAKPIKNNTVRSPKWSIYLKESYIKFEIPIILYKLKGQFLNYNVRNFRYLGYNQTLKNSELWIPVNTIQTDSIYRDKSILSEFFLDAKQYPYIKVKITNIIPFNISQNYFFIEYELTIKDIKNNFKEIVYLKTSWNKIIVQGEIYIPRKDFNLKGNLLLDLLLDNYFYLVIQYR